MNAPNESFPLAWPPSWPRTPPSKISRARFGVSVRSDENSYCIKGQVTLYVGRERLLDELRKLGATQVVLSTNIPVRLDGLPYSKAREPDDHGVAVYFRIKGEPRVLACDKWNRVADNLAALAAHIDAVRGQLRWGVGTIEQAFGGYRALPAMGATKPWWEILGVKQDAPWPTIEARREALLHIHHPDRGGNGNQAAEINAAFDVAKRERAA